MKVSEAVANAFVKEGTEVVFGLMGDGNMSWWSAISKYAQVRMIAVRDEGAGLAMAQGWARYTNKVGVCSVTHGPGITRMTTSLVAAVRSHTPVVICTSKTPFNSENHIQFVEQERVVGATGAGYLEALTPSFAENAVRQAFYRARLESRPIVLSIPHDIQAEECDGDIDDYQPSGTMYAGRQHIRPDRARLNEAVNIIGASKRPVVIVGRGAMEPEAIEAAERLAKRIGALIATTLIAKGLLGNSEYCAGISGLFSPRAVMQLYQETDCVIAIGASLNTRTIAGGHLYPNARIVHIDIAPHLLMGNEQAADCYIQGDAAATIQDIDDMLEKQGVTKEGYRTDAVLKILQSADRDPGEFEIGPGTVDPREAARIMDERLPSNVGVVIGAGHFSSFPVMIMKKPRALHIFVHDFGSIGQGLANAIGIGVACGQPLLCVEGDGGAMQNIQELDTAARLGLKLLYVIMNDEGFGAEYHMMTARGLNPKLALYRSPDFAGAGRVFGGRGRIATSLENIAAGIDEFLAGEGPMVLDIRVSRNVVSIPYRRAQFAQDV